VKLVSLKPQPIGPVPEETARVARAAFPKGNAFVQMRDELGVLWEDEDFSDLFPTRGQRALAPWRLALVTVMQFAENLPDWRNRRDLLAGCEHTRDQACPLQRPGEGTA
jgi:transposase